MLSEIEYNSKYVRLIVFESARGVFVCMSFFLRCLVVVWNACPSNRCSLRKMVTCCYCACMHSNNRSVLLHTAMVTGCYCACMHGYTK
jgi:hypothetical protein